VEVVDEAVDEASCRSGAGWLVELHSLRQASTLLSL
jgi:hypothetical protein